MAIPRILAMTAEEIRHTAPTPQNAAYFGCCFSADGSIRLPDHLPSGGGLILDDRIPIPDTDHSVLAGKLKALNPKFVILDLQRQPNIAAEKLIRALTELPCPIALPPPYANGRRDPVLLPPLPPHTPVEEHLSPWLDREIWLELALDATQITVTAGGSTVASFTHAISRTDPHRDSMLHCHYKITRQPDAIVFYCYRTREDVEALLRSPLPPNVTHTVALFQEFGK